MMKIEIKDKNNIWKEYLSSKPEIINNRIKIQGFYFGSSTRIGEMGTLYNKENSYEKEIRILTEKEDIVCNFKITKDILEKNNPNKIFNKKIPNLCNNIVMISKDKKIIINLRELHRYSKDLYEISSIILENLNN